MWCDRVFKRVFMGNTLIPTRGLNCKRLFKNYLITLKLQVKKNTQTACASVSARPFTQSIEPLYRPEISCTTTYQRALG